MWDTDSDDFFSSSSSSLSSMAKNNFTCLKNLTTPLAAVVGLTCSLSIIGSTLIILSYIVIPSIRTKARGILVNLSLMDFLVGVANLVGISMEFNKHLNLDGYHGSSYYGNSTWERLCVAQASVAMYATWSSILWTNCIAVYIYFRVITDEDLSRKVLYSLYVVAYGLPLILVVWQIISDRFGFDRHAASSWCSSVVTKDGHGLPFNAVFVNDIWIYLTIFLVTLLLVALHFHFKLEVKGRSVLTRNTDVMVNRVERKLLFIPVFFILLRIWSSMYVFLTLELGVHFSCKVNAFFIFASGMGDSGQGFTNAILYVFATPKVRNHFIRVLTCHSLPKRLVNGGQSDSSWHSRNPEYSSFASSENRKEYSGEMDPSVDKVPRSLLLNN